MRALAIFVILIAAVAQGHAQPVKLFDAFDSFYDQVIFDNVGEKLSAARIAAYKMAYNRLAKAKKVGQSGVCTLYGVEFACSKRSFADLKLPENIAGDISEGLSAPDTMPFGNVILEGPLPPPVPYLVLAQAARDKGRPRFTTAGRLKSEAEAVIGRQGLSFRPGTPKSAPFEAAVAADALRNFTWPQIEDFTSFAPEQAVMNGGEVMSLLRQLAGDSYVDTRCIGVCPRVVRRHSGGRTDHLMCFYNRMDGVTSAPFHCSIVAFEEGQEVWLRTRHVYQISYHEGTGPEETFRCDTSLDRDASFERLKTLLSGLEYRVIGRKRPDSQGGHMIIASALGRVSDVASNRWEVANLSLSFLDGSTFSPAARTVILYTIPTYKLSPTRVKEIVVGAALSPETFDQGLTPPEKVSRAFEASLQRQIATALPGGRCDAQPFEGGTR
jgi:hypothetical protein